MSVEAMKTRPAAIQAARETAQAARTGGATGSEHHHEDAALPAGSGKAPSRLERLSALTRSWGLRTASVLAGLGLWYWAAKIHLDLYIRFANVPSPLVVGAALWRHLHEAKFYMHIAVSMERIALGYALAAAIGIVLGLVMGRSRLARDLLIPYIELLRPIPAVAWIPLAILMWPTEESSIN
jgi:NitT/TauT family transport system permease protein